MEFFNAITDTYDNATKAYSDAKDAAYEYAGEKVTELHSEAKEFIGDTHKAASEFETSLRDGATDIVDDIAERNQTYYTEIKDNVQTQVTDLAEYVGMDDAGKAVNNRIDQGAELVQSAGEVITEIAHEGAKDLGTLNQQRKIVHAVLDSIPTDDIENETLRSVAENGKKGLKEAVDTTYGDVQAGFAGVVVDGLATVVKTEIAMHDPIPTIDGLKINDTKVLEVSLSVDAHIGVGGGVGSAAKATLSRIGADEYVATLDLDVSVKAGVGESIGKAGLAVDVGVEGKREISIRGSKETMEAFKKAVKNGDVLTMDRLIKMSPDEINISGHANALLDGTVGTTGASSTRGLGGNSVYKNGQLVTQLVVSSKVSAKVGVGFSGKLPSGVRVPDLGASFELKGAIGSDGVVELTAKADGNFGTDSVAVEGKARVDLVKLGMSKEKVLDLIKTGDFNPSDFGVELTFEASKTEMLEGGDSWGTSIGGLKNHTTRKTVLAKADSNIAPADSNNIGALSLPKIFNAFQMGMKF